MAFVHNPTSLKMPYIPDRYMVKDLYTGIGEDKNFLVFQTNSDIGPYVMTENLVCYNLKIDNNIYRPIMREVDGHIFWVSSSNCIYRCSLGIVIANLYPGTTPYEFYNSEIKDYDGDEFWSGSIPDLAGQSVVFEPRGRIRNTNRQKTVEFHMPRWRSDSLLGEYHPADSETEGVKYFGNPKFIDNTGKVYIRSSMKKKNNFQYGAIEYKSNKWIIGEIGSKFGWHEGTEPKINGSVKFKFCHNENDKLNGSDITVSFDSFVLGEEITPVYLGEVAIWR